jgi:putative FmdB family regulatory protein
MPIYEYRCPNGHVFELFQKMSDPQPEVCVECGAGPVEKVLYPVAVHYKGSGFYSTDYGKGGGRKPSKDGDGSSSSSTGDSSSGGGGDAKPATTEKKAASGGSGSSD